MPALFTFDRASFTAFRAGRCRRRRAALLAVACSAAVATVAAPASAAPPSNDSRTAAQELGRLPALVSGTTVDATLEQDEPFSGVGPIRNSVWL